MMNAREQLTMLFKIAFGEKGVIADTCERLLEQIEDAAFERGQLAERETIQMIDTIHSQGN